MGVAENLAEVRSGSTRRAGGRPGSGRGAVAAGQQDHGPELIREAYDAGRPAVRGEQGAGGGREGRDLRRRAPICAGRSSGTCRPTRPSRSPPSPASSTPSTRSGSPTRSIGGCTTSGGALDVFVQVNSSGEDSKFGLPPEEVESFVEGARPSSQPADPRPDDAGDVLRRHRAGRRLLRPDAAAAGPAAQSRRPPRAATTSCRWACPETTNWPSPRRDDGPGRGGDLRRPAAAAGLLARR